MATQETKVVYLNNELSRLKEAERLLVKRIQLDKNRNLADFEYAQAIMQQHIEEIAWSKRWQIK